MASRKEVLSALSKLKDVGHLVAAFKRATSPRSANKGAIGVNEFKRIVNIANNRGPKGIGAEEWKAILAIEKYDSIGPKAKTYIEGVKKRWNIAAIGRGGFTVSLDHAAKFKGKRLSDEGDWKKYQGECAAGVQYVFYKAGKPLGKTSTWKQGVRVKGNNVAPGTAIASFRKGKWAEDHAAILIQEMKKGLWVWDQFNNTASGKPKPWGKRMLPFDWKGTSAYSNDGDYFFVITK